MTPTGPTLRRHAPQDADKSSSGQPGGSDEVASLNDDPNRPLLHRGKPDRALTDADIPKLSGLPGDQDLHQLVAVSDAANRPPHDFSRAWQDEDEHQAILAKMQAAARAQLAALRGRQRAAPTLLPRPQRLLRRRRTRPPANSRATVTPQTPPPPPPAPPEPLLEEQLMGYTLSYGGSPTYVYSAHTDGLGPTLRFVTVVAQVDMNGEPEIAHQECHRRRPPGPHAAHEAGGRSRRRSLQPGQPALRAARTELPPVRALPRYRRPAPTRPFSPAPPSNAPYFAGSPTAAGGNVEGAWAGGAAPPLLPSCRGGATKTDGCFSPR